MYNFKEIMRIKTIQYVPQNLCNKILLFLYYMLNLILLVIDKRNFADIFKNSIGVPSPKKCTTKPMLLL